MAQKLAGLFGATARSGRRCCGTGPPATTPTATGGPLDEDLRWQAELWRRVRGSHRPAEPGRAGRGGARPAARTAPRAGSSTSRAGCRSSVRRGSPRDQLQVLDALAEHRDVHLWLPHPSDRLWAPGRPTGRPAVTPRREDPTATLPRHPLLRSCGRDARELQVRLGAHGLLPGGVRPARVDRHLPVAAPTRSTLLAALQDDLAEDRAPSPVHRRDASDRSIQVHACHGPPAPGRGAAGGPAGDARGRPHAGAARRHRDVPGHRDLRPAAHRGLRPGRRRPGGRRRRRAPRAPAARSGSPTVRCGRPTPCSPSSARLLDLADARLTGPEVLDLAALPPVRARFGFDEDAPRAAALTGCAGRASAGGWTPARAGAVPAAGRRPEHLAGGARPGAGRGRHGRGRPAHRRSRAAPGRRRQQRGRPRRAVRRARRPARGRHGRAASRAAPPGVGRRAGRRPRRADLGAAPRRLAGRARPAASWPACCSGPVPGRRRRCVGLGDVRALLAHRLRGRPTRANFRTGRLTVCTMVPMRSVPHRVVCLLGVDDGVFPRGRRVDGDDVLQRDPLVGERDRAQPRTGSCSSTRCWPPRSALVVLHTGADERTGAAAPAGRPAGRAARRPGPDARRRPARGRRARRAPAPALRRAELQPATPTVTRARSASTPASYDGALARLSPRRAAPPFLSGPLPETLLAATPAGRWSSGWWSSTPSCGSSSTRCARFLRTRLGLASTSRGGGARRRPPAGAGCARALGRRRPDAHGRAGRRPGGPGGPGGVAARRPAARARSASGWSGRSCEHVDALVDAARPVCGPARRRRSTCRSGLDGGWRLVGTVPGVHGDRVVRVVYSRLGAKHRLRAWVHLLGARRGPAGRPGRDGRPRPRRGRGPPPRWAGAWSGRCSRRWPHRRRPRRGTSWSELCSSTVPGCAVPLPLTPKTSCAYAERRRAGLAGPARAR